MTTNPTVPISLGTRHRAAIGITEESDCLALVVSEETGDVSVAAFGEIHWRLSLREIDERINSHFGVGKLGQRPTAPEELQPENAAKSLEKARR